jgi:ribose 5-phosphate isomerase B
LETIKIALASDHAGYYMKHLTMQYLISKGYDVKDFGSYSTESVDYADFAHPMAEAVEKEEFQLGFSFCGSGNGINITVNKHQKIRAGLCWNAEIAKLARQHNDANVCSIPARYVTANEVIDIVDAFLSSSFEGGRHCQRVSKIPVK